MSKKPENYYELAADDRMEAFQGANLVGRDLRGAQAIRGFFVRADLRQAKLSGADLSHAIL